MHNTITDLYTRHESKTDRRGPDECWPWIGALRHGHGVLNRGRRGEGMAEAHRVAYERAFGPIPDGLVIDHECHNRDTECPGGKDCRHRRCQNPKHLTAKTRGANVLASSRTLTAREKGMSHCSRGHEFTDANTYLYRGMRYCRTCRREYAARYYREHHPSPDGNLGG